MGVLGKRRKGRSKVNRHTKHNFTENGLSCGGARPRSLEVTNRTHQRHIKVGKHPTMKMIKLLKISQEGRTINGRPCCCLLR